MKWTSVRGSWAPVPPSNVQLTGGIGVHQLQYPLTLKKGSTDERIVTGLPGEINSWLMPIKYDMEQLLHTRKKWIDVFFFFLYF